MVSKDCFVFLGFTVYPGKEIWQLRDEKQEEVHIGWTAEGNYKTVMTLLVL